MDFFNSSSSGSYCTSVRLMKSDVLIAKSLGIRLTKAFQLGLKILVDLEIERGSKHVDPAILESWKSTRENEIDEIVKYLSQEKRTMETINHIVNTQKKTESENKNKCLWVWDRLINQRVYVPESLFDPSTMVKEEG